MPQIKKLHFCCLDRVVLTATVVGRAVQHDRASVEVRATRTTARVVRRVGDDDAIRHDRGWVATHAAAGLLQHFVAGVPRRAVGQREPGQHGPAGEINASHRAVAIGAARHLITLDRGQRRAVDTANDQRFRDRHAV